MGTVFDRPYAPSTLDSFPREFTVGHIRQLDRLVTGLRDRTPLVAGVDGRVLVDIDDTIIKYTDMANEDPVTDTPASGD